MTQIGLGVEKDKKDDKDQLIINSPYVIQPHIQQRRKPSNFMVFIAILLTLCVIVMTVLGMVWLVRSHVWLSYWNPVAEPTPTPAYDGGHEYGKFGGAAGIQSIEETRMTFDEIWSVRAKSFSGQWLRDPNVDHLVFRNDTSGDLERYDVENDVTDTLVPNAIFVNNEIQGYYPNYNGDFILLTYDHQKVWRHSFRSRAMIYNTETGTEIAFPSDASLQNERLQYVNWAPQGNGLVFVQGNNIYYQQAPDSAPMQLTTDGEEVTIFNGIPDWVYEEDVLGSASASYLSDDGQYLVFGRFDDTNVPIVEYPLYLPNSDTYASQYRAAYPMAGLSEDRTLGSNTIATLHLVDTLQSGTGVPEAVDIDPPADIAATEHYYTRVEFVAPNTVAITWANRAQTFAIIQICAFTTNGGNPPSVDCTDNYRQDVTNGWIDAPWPAPIPDLESDLYYTYLMNPNSDGSYKQIASISISIPVNSTYGTIRFFEELGAQEVQGLVAFDSDKILYFYSTNGVQRNRHLMSMDPADPENIQCISCQVEDCDYVSASFSPSAEFFLLSCLGPDVPRYELYQVYNSSYTEQIAVMEDNEELKDALAAKDLPVREFMQFTMNNDVNVSAEVYHPPDREQGSFHPLLVYVYGGPGSLQVTSRFGYGSTTNNWLRYLGSAFNVAVASVDARGTIGLGEDWKFLMYKQLANIEIQDQIAFGESLREQLDYLHDDDPAAIFGWSYGGFAASHVLGRNETSFGCAVAVAPVSSKRYYDTAYTERYMGLITDDEAAYNATDLFQYAPNFKDRKYFIAHGTHDDNVHFRHFTTFVDALTRAEVQFRSQVYVDEDHSINSPQQSQHLFQAMTNFLNDDCYTYGYQAPTSPPTMSTTPGGSESHRITFTLLLAALLAAIFGALH